MPRLYRRHPVPRIAALLALLACLFVPAAGAQLWQGPAALEVRADGKGSMAGATVELVYLALDPPAGPPPVTLDARGRAVIGGLAEGMWRVSVSREGYMTYQAEVDVRRDEKPNLTATFQQNVPGATQMMKVKLARARPSGPAAPPPPPQIAERPAPRPVEATPAPAPAPAQPAPPVEETPRPQPVPQQPAPQPEPETPAAAPVPRPEPVQPELRPAPPVAERPEPSTQPPPAPAPRPTPAPPTPAPAPPVDPAPTPTPPAPAAPSGGSVRHRSFADRTCYECKPGESSLSVEQVVGSGVGCGPAARDAMAQSGNGAALPEGCGILRLSLPAGTRYTGYRYEVQDRTGSVDCMAGRNCPGGGRWPADPALVRSASGTTVTAAFENIGAGGDRRAVLTVYYMEGEETGSRRP